MNISLNNATSRAVYDQVRAETRQGEACDSPSYSKYRMHDEIIISPEGRAAAEATEVTAKKWDLDELDAIIRENAPALLEAGKTLNAQQELKMGKYVEVDPDGSIRFQAYIDSLEEQADRVEQVITDYYAAAHRVNSSMPLADALGHIALKYLDGWSNNPHFRSDMSSEERHMAYRQERFLLTTGRIFTLADPYATASIGGCLNFFEAEKIAKQAAQDKLDALLAERQQQQTANGLDEAL